MKIKLLFNLIKFTSYIAVGVILLVLLWFCNVYDFQGEKVLIPKGYSGPVSIFYNRKRGMGIKCDDKNTIIYKIPHSGKLFVSYEDYIHRGTPLQNREYFFYDESTDLILEEIKEYTDKSDSDNYLVDFQYGPDSVDFSGKNYYSEYFVISKNSKRK